MIHVKLWPKEGCEPVEIRHDGDEESLIKRIKNSEFPGLPTSSLWRLRLISKLRMRARRKNCGEDC
jgi:hypothetical protein